MLKQWGDRKWEARKQRKQKGEVKRSRRNESSYDRAVKGESFYSVEPLYDEFVTNQRMELVVALRQLFQKDLNEFLKSFEDSSPIVASNRRSASVDSNLLDVLVVEETTGP
jgi:hypothetical protein